MHFSREFGWSLMVSNYKIRSTQSSYDADALQKALDAVKTDLGKLAFQLAVKKGLQHPFSCEKQQAGKAWLHGFLQRHPAISVRILEATSLSRAVGFNKPTVMKFFDMYKNERQTEYGMLTRQQLRLYMCLER